jgi:hypothetical protein
LTATPRARLTQIAARGFADNIFGKKYMSYEMKGVEVPIPLARFSASLRIAADA